MKGIGWLAAAAGLVVGPPGASARPPFDLPWGDVPPRIESGIASIEAAALGRPDPRARSLPVARSSARKNGERRARAMIHGAIDDALSAVLADPRVAEAAHEAIEASAEVAGTRPLADGAAVVLVAVPVSHLREAASPPGVPWAE